MGANIIAKGKKCKYITITREVSILKTILKKQQQALGC